MTIAKWINGCLSAFGVQVVRQSATSARDVIPPNVVAGGDGVLVPGKRRYATRHSTFRGIAPRDLMIPAGFLPTFGGSLIRGSFFNHQPAPNEERQYTIETPIINEEYWEWIDLVEAIFDADDEFVMAEIGAGYGRWLVAAACLSRYLRPSISLRLIAAEAEPSHYQMMKVHFSDNGLDPAEHHLVEAAVNSTGGTVRFSVGHPEAWYGQSIVRKGTRFAEFPNAVDVSVRAVTIAELIEREARVDLIDMDIQGAEGDVIKNSVPTLNKKVRRLHVGTHSHDVEETIYQSLSAAGWYCVACFPCGGFADTDFGPVDFQDGVQSWINPRLL